MTQVPEWSLHQDIVDLLFLAMFMQTPTSVGENIFRNQSRLHLIKTVKSKGCHLSPRLAGPTSSPIVGADLLLTPARL
jgi:hypothetical protein